MSLFSPHSIHAISSSTMAISTISESSLACIHCIKTTHKNPKFNPPKNSPILLLISHPSCPSRILIVNSSRSFPPPVLEDHESTDSPLLELDLKFQEFDNQPLPQQENINLLICSLLKDPKTEEIGFERYQKAKLMPDFRPTRSTLHNLIRYSLRLKNWNSIWSISEDFSRFNVYPDASSCCRLISSCIRAKRLKLANNLLHVLKFEKEVAVLSFNAAMRSYNKLHMYSSAVKVFDVMSSSAVKVYEDLVADGCDPGQVTYASVLNVYFRLGLYDKAEEVFWEMDNKGFDKCVVAYSSMISMYGKVNRIRDAMRLLARMKERGVELNVWIYNSILDMHGKVLNLKQVEKIWKEMKRRKVVADKVSYTSVINAYSKAREFDTCMKYYYEYRLNGGRVDRAMGGIMVGVFSKVSRVDELVKLLQDMKSEGTGLDVRLYRSSLNALRDAVILECSTGHDPWITVTNPTWSFDGKARHFSPTYPTTWTPSQVHVIL
ncbi:hypothetical protein E3N88_19527 [Mikania micrantha]|uniref:Pentacotripeptide-repeat region of PRORP domain-containing protein n=1 Tax=Mikania micrantha TaxID=192012 RepID=A0A5N6NNP6_9ASTR|nr:hypothetical protein E3N88_19527 [Mikania micrantha]